MLKVGLGLVSEVGRNLLASGLLRPHTYLDPGSGSYLLQLLIAGLLGAALTVRLYWSRIKAFFVKRFGKGGDDEAE